MRTKTVVARCAVGLLCLAGAVTARAETFLASDQNGALYRIDSTTAVATVTNAAGNPEGSTEIEAAPSGVTLWMEGSDGSPYLMLVTGCGYQVTGAVAHDYGALNGLEFVGGTLYGTFIPDADNPSTLVTVNTTTGALTAIGLTGYGPISGLAYRGTTMYGVTAGSAAANLVTINLTTGAASLVAAIRDAAGAPLDRIGSIEFGTDGNLYGGLTGTASQWATGLIRIDTTTGVATLVGSTGVSVTGLTQDIGCETIPTTNRWGQLALVVLLVGAALLLLARRSATA